MYFRQIIHEENSCLSYLVGCPGQKVCAAIDPQGDPNTYQSQLAKVGLKLTVVIETHVQADHISIAQELAERSQAKLYFGPGAQVTFQHQQLEAGQLLQVGNRHIKVIHTPGHTKEHICLFVDDWFVLTGDTLFVGDVGRVDLTLDDGETDELNIKANQLYTSLKKLLQLPDWTEIYPGHYSGSVCGKGMDGKTISTIGRERKYNKALRLSEEEFAKYVTENLPPPPESFHMIKHQNLGLRR